MGLNIKMVSLFLKEIQMPNYAVIQNDIVVNVIVANNLNTVNEVVTASSDIDMYKNSFCVEILEDQKGIGIGSKYVNKQLLQVEQIKEIPKILKTT